jgi:hypothetical protein
VLRLEAWAHPEPGGGKQWSGLTGGEILPAHDYQDGGTCWRGLLQSLALFSLVVPPLQLGVMGPYPVRGVWFPNRLPLEELVISRFLGHNRPPTVPGIQDPYSGKAAWSKHVCGLQPRIGFYRRCWPRSAGTSYNQSELAFTLVSLVPFGFPNTPIPLPSHSA